jgi:hypothetical protein
MLACIRYRPAKVEHCASCCAKHQRHPTTIGTIGAAGSTDVRRRWIVHARGKKGWSKKALFHAAFFAVSAFKTAFWRGPCLRTPPTAAPARIKLLTPDDEPGDRLARTVDSFSAKIS